MDVTTSHAHSLSSMIWLTTLHRLDPHFGHYDGHHDCQSEGRDHGYFVNYIKVRIDYA